MKACRIGYVSLGRNGEHWPKHNWLLPLAASPLVFAFGLAGTLMFNLFGLGVAGAGLFRWARAFASPPAAACASIAFVFGSAIVGQNAYDFSTDAFLLACFSQGLAALASSRGAGQERRRARARDALRRDLETSWGREGVPPLNRGSATWPLRPRACSLSPRART